MRKVFLLIMMSILLAGCGSSLYGRSGAGGGVAGQGTVLQW